MEKEPKKMGRPTHYSDELADIMCQIIESHPQSDENLCKMYSFFPAEVSTLWYWRNKHEYFKSAYLRAKELQIENRLENLVKECDDRDQDFREHGGRLYANNVRGNLMRAKMGFLQWHAACIDPEKYGSKKLEDKIDDVKHDLIDIKARVEKNRDRL